MTHCSDEMHSLDLIPDLWTGTGAMQHNNRKTFTGWCSTGCLLIENVHRLPIHTDTLNNNGILTLTNVRQEKQISKYRYRVTEVTSEMKHYEPRSKVSNSPWISQINEDYQWNWSHPTVAFKFGKAARESIFWKMQYWLHSKLRYISHVSST